MDMVLLPFFLMCLSNIVYCLRKKLLLFQVLFFVSFFAMDEMEDYITCELIGGGAP